MTFVNNLLTLTDVLYTWKEHIQKLAISSPSAQLIYLSKLHVQVVFHPGQQLMSASLKTFSFCKLSQKPSLAEFTLISLNETTRTKKGYLLNNTLDLRSWGLFLELWFTFPCPPTGHFNGYLERLSVVTEVLKTFTAIPWPSNLASQFWK